MWARRGKKQKRKIRIILVLAILVVKCACFHNNIERIIISVRKLGRQQKQQHMGILNFKFKRPLVRGKKTKNVSHIIYM